MIAQVNDQSAARDVSETLAPIANADGEVWGSLVLQFLGNHFGAGS